MREVSIIGVGKLGLCFALNLERNGFAVTAVDLNQDYIDSLNLKSFRSFEPHVNEFLEKSKGIEFTTDLDKALINDVIFVVVSTPSTDDNKYDHSHIDVLVENLITYGVQDRRKDIVINCTTFPGYCEKLHNKLSRYNYHISYNPEFIAQGSIIHDQIYCDSVLIGESDEYAGDIISEIYSGFVESDPIYNRMSRTEAELAKLSLNCFLTTKISFANMIGDIAVRLGCDAETVLNSIGSDSRVGNKYLKPGFGFGGPCFPRDNRALSKCADEVGVDAVISKATDQMNKLHLEYQLEQFKVQNPDTDLPVFLDYITYKPESVIIEESQQLEFALRLSELGYDVKVNDKRPEVQQYQNFKKSEFPIFDENFKTKI